MMKMILIPVDSKEGSIGLSFWRTHRDREQEDTMSLRSILVYLSFIMINILALPSSPRKSDLSVSPSSLLARTSLHLSRRGRPFLDPLDSNAASSSTSDSNDDDDNPTPEEGNAEGAQIQPNDGLDAARPSSIEPLALQTTAPSPSQKRRPSPYVYVHQTPNSPWEYHIPTTTAHYDHHPHLRDVINSAIQFIYAALPLSALVPPSYIRPIANLANFDVGTIAAGTGNSRTEPLLNLEIRVDDLRLPFHWRVVVEALRVLWDWAEREEGINCITVYYRFGNGAGAMKVASVGFTVARGG